MNLQRKVEINMKELHAKAEELFVEMAGIIAVTAVLTILFTKIRIAWWLRRKRFALGRLAVVVVSMFISMITVLLLVLT